MAAFGGFSALGLLLFAGLRSDFASANAGASDAAGCGSASGTSTSMLNGGSDTVNDCSKPWYGTASEHADTVAAYPLPPNSGASELSATR